MIRFALRTLAGLLHPDRRVPRHVCRPHPMTTGQCGICGRTVRS